MREARRVIEAVYKTLFLKELSEAEPDIQRVMDSGKVTDHHAIIPTIELAEVDLSSVPDGEGKILSLAANRLLCATGEKQEYETVRAEFCCNGTNFTKCGMNVSRIMGAVLTDVQIKDMLAGNKILLKGLKSKAGKTYDAYIVPNGTEEYLYTREGEEKRGIQFKFQMEFPKKKFSGGKKK